jgi:hypothetical protein
MAAPTADEIRALLSDHVRYWNEDRFDDWVAVFPDDIELEDPVGSPVRVGKQMSLVDNWNHSHGAWHLEVTNLIVVGNEAAMSVRNTGNVDGQKVIVDSIELYTFGDGTLRGRMFFNPPGG